MPVLVYGSIVAWDGYKGPDGQSAKWDNITDSSIGMCTIGGVCGRNIRIIFSSPAATTTRTGTEPAAMARGKAKGCGRMIFPVGVIRGVDVRILISERADHIIVWLSAFTFYEQSIVLGVKLFRYHKGFLHEKVMLIDERLAAVGTANLDHRSFRLNFEITGFSPDPGFVREIKEMLDTGFLHAREARAEDFTCKPFLFRAACRAARLFTPVQVTVGSAHRDATKVRTLADDVGQHLACSGRSRCAG